MIVTKRISTSAENVQDLIDTIGAFELTFEIEDPEPSAYDGKMLTPIKFSGEHETVVEFMMWQFSVSRKVAERMVGTYPPGVPEEAGGTR